MSNSLRSSIVALVLVAVVLAVAAPALAAPVERTPRRAGITGVGFLSQLMAEVYMELQDWFGGAGLQSQTAASNGDMDPNGTSAPAPSAPSSAATLSPSGGAMGPSI